MKRILIAYVIFCCTLISNTWLNAKGQPEIKWTGCDVAVGIGDQYYKNVGWLEGIELGLREDGVVVWRETDQTTNAH